MDEKMKAYYMSQAQVFKALAHPTRLLIVDQLGKGEKCVCEITPMIGADTSTVSKHLSVLRSAGVIQSEKRGQMVYYSLKMNCVLGFFSCVRKAVEEEAKVRLAAVTA